MKRIIIMPIGKVDPEFLLSISAAVGTKFHTKAEVDRKISIPPDSYKERAAKEAIHELGHVYGLDHCSHPECICISLTASVIRIKKVRDSAISARKRLASERRLVWQDMERSPWQPRA